MYQKFINLSIFIFCFISQLNPQTNIFYQGFEGNSSDNWNFIGGNVNDEIARTGTNSARVGRSGESNTLTFGDVNISSFSDRYLEIYHAVRSGSGPGMDTREGVVYQVKLNGGAWNTIGRISGINDHNYTWNQIGGTSNTCSPADNYQMPNPMTYNIPETTNTIQIRFITIDYQGTTGSCNAACRCDLFKAAMTNDNPTPMNYDRSDEGFFIDDVRIVGTPSSSLPISLLNFDIKCNSKENQLYWTTLSEQNNDYFTIQLSKDGNNFETIAKINGHGNSTSEKHYIFNDNKHNQKVYYRLIQTDYDGKNEYLKTISSECFNDIIKIYPNPSSGIINISNMEENTNIKIYNMLGELIQNETVVEKQTSLKLNNGVYFIHLNSENNSKIEKIIVQ